MSEHAWTVVLKCGHEAGGRPNEMFLLQLSADATLLLCLKYCSCMPCQLWYHTVLHGFTNPCLLVERKIGWYGTTVLVPP